MKSPAIVWLSLNALVLLLWSGRTLAQVPTASFDDEDVTSPAAPASSSTQQQSASPDTGAVTPHAAGSQSSASTHMVPEPTGMNQTAIDTLPLPSPVGPSGMAALEERTFRTTMAILPGFARLSLYVSEPGSTVFVTERRKEFDERLFDFALARCGTQCVVELPLGSYTVWVKTSDDARSSRDFELRSSRWMSVAPANQVMRDFGFVAGAVGTAATILGVGILSELVCETCTSTGRHITGGLAFGLGLPMGAVGWSLYFIHKEARIADHILTQAERPGTAVTGSPPMRGAVLQTRFVF